jgi:hypothetical protein
MNEIYSQSNHLNNEYFNRQNKNINSLHNLSFKDFIQYIIYIVKSLQNGVGLNVIFSQNNKLIYIGIILIIISILLLPIIF